MKSDQQKNESQPVLSYAAPVPEPLGRWFLRKAILFIVVIVAYIVFVAVLGRVLGRLGVFDSMVHN